MANEPLPTPDQIPDPDLTPQPDSLDQQPIQPSQTPLDSLNDVLDMGEDIRDTVEQVKDVAQKAKELTGKGAKVAEKGVEEGAEKALENEAVAQGRSGWLNGAKKKVAEGRAKVAARQAARKAEKAAAKQAGKQVGKAAAKYGAKAAARWAAEAASGLADAGLSWLLLAADVLLTAAYALVKKYGKYIVVFGAVMLALPGIIFLFYFGAIGATLTAGSPVEKAQTVVALALGADPNSTREVIITAANTMKERLTGIIKLMPNGAAAVVIAEGVQTKLAELIKVADQPEKRKALMAEINTDLKKISDAHPDLIYSKGNCADLQKYLDSGQLSEYRPDRRGKDLKTIVNGFVTRGGTTRMPKEEVGQRVPVNPRLCNVMIFLMDNGFKIGSVTMAWGHKKYVGDGSKRIVSQHYVGEGIDLALINGSGSPNSSKWQADTKRMQTLLQQNAKQLQIYQLIGPHQVGLRHCAITTYTDSDHRDHVHIGVANETHIKNYEACRR